MRKYLISTLLLMILLLTLFSASAYAEMGTIIGDDVNLRSGPGMNYEVLGCFEKGTEVIVHDRSNPEWYSVTVDGVRGFMAANFLSLNGSETEPTGTGTGSTGGEAGYINAMYVRLRAEASLDATILGEYNSGTTLSITGTNGEWTAVIINGQSGYVFSSFVSRGTPGTQPTTQETPAPEDTIPVIDDGTNAVLVKDDVYLFCEPSFYSDVKGVFNKGDRLIVTEENGDWYTVIIQGFPGYIYRENVSRDDNPTTPSTPAPTPAPTPVPTPVPTPEPTPEVSDGTNAVLVKDDVYLFCEPSFYSEVKGVFNKGERLIVTEENGDWYTVLIHGYPGYVYRENVSKEDLPVPTPTPTPAPTPVPTPEPTPEVSDGTNAVLVKDDVYLFCEPSFYSDVRGVFNKGERLIITEENGDWYTVLIQGYPGYVYRENVSKEELPAPTPTPAPTTPPLTTESKSGYVNADHVHLRSEPSLSSAIKAVFDKNTRLTITGVTGDWVAVKIQGYEGYIYKDFVTADDTSEPTPTPAPEATPEPTPEPTAAPTTEEAGYITGNNVRMRAEPSVSGEILGVYNAGTKLTITGTSGDWTAVTINGTKGYVYSTYVAKGEITVPVDAPTASEEGVQMAQFALQFVGYPYVWGGTSPSTGFDCSGLAYYTYTHFGYSMYRVANDQTQNGVHVDASELQPGDLLCFYSGGSYVGHVGIYIGDGKFVHASTYTTGVIVSELSGYYTTRGFEARRIAGTDKNGPGIVLD